MANVHAGYMGAASIYGQNVKFNSCSIAAKQTVDMPDLVTGGYDRLGYNYGKIDISGSISGPATAASAQNFWNWAVKRDECGVCDETTANIQYYCNATGQGIRSFTVLPNSFTLSCAAGDVAQFSIDVIGRKLGSGTPTPSNSIEKLLTWDKVSLTASGSKFSGALAYSNFSITVANNITPVYSLGPNAEGQRDYYPYELVSGIRTCTGTISVYDVPDAPGADNWDDVAIDGSLTFDIGGTSITISNIAWHRVEPASQPGPIISTVGFSALGAFV